MNSVVPISKNMWHNRHPAFAGRTTYTTQYTRPCFHHYIQSSHIVSNHALHPQSNQTVGQWSKDDLISFPLFLTGVLHSRCVRGPSVCVCEPPEQCHTPLHLRHTGPVLLSVTGECSVLQSWGLRQQHTDQVMHAHISCHRSRLAG